MRVSIKVYYFSVFNEGSFDLILDEKATIFEILTSIGDKYGNTYEKISGRNLLNDFGTYFKVFLNGKYVNLPLELKKKVNHGDNILILHPVSGG